MSAHRMGLGENSAVLDRLDRGYKERNDRLLYLRADPMTDPTRSALIPALSSSCPESACTRPRRDRVRNSAEDQKPDANDANLRTGYRLRTAPSNVTAIKHFSEDRLCQAWRVPF
jgi:hypothetical protein